MANLQLDYFVNKVRNLVDKIPASGRNPLKLLDRALENWDHKDKHEIFKFREISLEEMERLIYTLSESNACGHDKIDSNRD